MAQSAGTAQAFERQRVAPVHVTPQAPQFEDVERSAQAPPQQRPARPSESAQLKLSVAAVQLVGAQTFPVP